LCGLTTETDPIRWKREQRPMRDRMKPLQLGINYGMGVPSLARGLQRHPLIASDFIERHKRRYPRYWWWRENQAVTAMLERRTESVFGWPLRVSMICSREPLSEKVAAEDALRMEIAAFVENHIEALVNALVHIAVVDAHTPPPIRARAK